MKDELLPIGSIIEVDNEKLMICAYVIKGSLIEGEQYDYACCKYPGGLSKDAVLVKKSQIKRVKFIGYQDDTFFEMKASMEE